MAVLIAVALVLLALCPAGADAAKPKLAGSVWVDSDRDGTRDAGEPLRAGVRVELLFAGKAGAKPVILRSTETDAAGTWTARSRAPGFYRARVLLPALVEGFTGADRGDDAVDSDVVTSGKRIGMTPRVKLRRGKRSRTFDAGLLPIAEVPDPDPDLPTEEPPQEVVSIGDVVFRDANANGIRAPTEAGVGGVTVEMWNAEKTTLLATTRTNAAGFWALPTTAGSTFRVRVITPDLLSPANQGADESLDSDINTTGPDAGFTDVLTATENTGDVDAGVYLAVGDLVWDDTNLNGIHEGGEPGYANVVVQLWNVPKTNLIDQDTTDANGAYELTVPAPGDYLVRALLPAPATMVYSPKDAAGDDAIDSDVNPSAPSMGFTDPVTITAGLTTTVDVGMH